MTPNHQLNEHQEKFLNKLLDAQQYPRPIKAVQLMQLAIKEFEQEIRDEMQGRINALVKVMNMQSEEQ